MTILRTSKKIGKSLLYIDDNPSVELHDFTRKCRMITRRYSIKMIIIDYLQLLQKCKSQAYSFFMLHYTHVLMWCTLRITSLHFKQEYGFWDEILPSRSYLLVDSRSIQSSYNNVPSPFLGTNRINWMNGHLTRENESEFGPEVWKERLVWDWVDQIHWICSLRLGDPRQIQKMNQDGRPETKHQIEKKFTNHQQFS